MHRRIRSTPLSFLLVGLLTTLFVPLSAQEAPAREGEGKAKTCTAKLAAGLPQTQPGCFIDERVTGTSGTLTYNCDGGRATADLGRGAFSGTVKAGNVDVALRTQYKFSDGCIWISKQRMTGTIGSGSLSYSYEEAPAAGQRGCATACTASASVEVTPSP